MKKVTSTKQNTKPSSSRFANLPTLKKPTKDYGAILVKALKRNKS